MHLLLSLVGGFVTGIFLRSVVFDSWYPVLFCVFIAAVFGLAVFLKLRTFYTVGFLFFISCSLGMLRMTLAESPLPQKFAAHVGERVAYEGRVVSDPDIREKNQRIMIEISRGGETTRMIAVVPKKSTVSVGDQVWVTGTLSLPKPFDTEGGRVFKYDKYLQRDGVRFLLNFGSIRTTSHAPWYSVPAFLARLKHTFLDGLSAVLPTTNAALAGGIVIGGKTGLGSDLQDAFIRSGLVQIIVLSGYNVMIVASWIMAVLTFIKLPKRWINIGGALALTLFVGIAGFTATALRAMCMALIALYAKATGHTYNAGRALLVVILLMLVWNPFYLVFDPGFGLSVAATAGLIWLSPLIEQRLLHLGKRAKTIFVSVPSAATPLHAAMRAGAERNAHENGFGPRSSPFWTNILATTLAAQFAVLPLLLYDMGIFSFVAIPANIIAAPVVPLAMAWSVIAGFAGIIFGSIFPIIGAVLASASYVLTEFLIKVATISAAPALSAVTIPAFPFWLVLLAYALLIYRAATASKRFSTTPQLTLAKKASI